MLRYIAFRILLVIPTLLTIILLNFVVVQFVPGGPVDRIIAEHQGIARSGVIASSSMDSMKITNSKGSASQMMDDELIDKIRATYGFDKPAYQRFFNMMFQFLQFSFGESYFRGESVMSLIQQALPVSASLGVLSTLVIYCISIPLGIYRARRADSRFDIYAGLITTVMCALPAFLVAILLLELFASGQWFSWFPLRGLTSGTATSTLGQIMDWLWHLVLPVLAMSIGGLAALSLLTRNSFIEEIHKNYVLLAQSKGLSMKLVMMRHVFRNALLIVIAGFPATLIGMFFAGSLVIEIIFSLQGLGLLGYESLLNRDYPVVFASLYLFSLMGLLVGIVNDLCYALIDPRIHFAKHRE